MAFRVAVASSDGKVVNQHLLSVIILRLEFKDYGMQSRKSNLKY